MNTNSRLYRSTSDKVIGGVAGGLADYLNIDPVIVRIIFVLLAVFGGSGVLVYIILWIVIPEKPFLFAEVQPEEQDGQEQQGMVDARRKSNSSLIAGIVLIAFGLLFLVDRLMPMYHIWDFWPLLLIGAGFLLIKPELFKSSKNMES